MPKPFDSIRGYNKLVYEFTSFYNNEDVNYTVQPTIYYNSLEKSLWWSLLAHTPEYGHLWKEARFVNIILITESEYTRKERTLPTLSKFQDLFINAHMVYKAFANHIEAFNKESSYLAQIEELKAKIAELESR